MNWIFSKLRGARSRLYRRRFLQVNTRWKALAEIYTMHSFAPFFKLKMSAKNRQHFFAIEKWISDFFIFCIEFCIFSANFLWIFVRISRQIPEKSDVCRFFTQICENKLENCRKFWNLWKIIQYYSILFNRVLSCGEVRSGTSLGSPSTCRAWRHRQEPLTRSITLERRSRSKKNCSG